MKQKNEHIVYLSLGSNVEPRQQTLQKAIDLIQTHYGGERELIVSPSYESEPWGFYSETNFINLCVQVQTSKTPEEILRINQKIEMKLGRRPKKSKIYASRPIDIDILFFDDYSISEEYLVIPHPHLEKRKFVLAPLNDIADNHLHTILNKTVGELLACCTDQSVVQKL